MRTPYAFPVLAVLALSLAAGCGGEKKEAPAPKAAEKAPVSSPAPAQPEPAPAPAHEAAPTLDGAVTVEEAADAEQPANDLVGSTWKVGEYTATFKDNSTVFVKGGPIDNVNPDGVEGTYTLKDGILEFQILGETRVGTWDGEKLVVDGNVGEKVQ